MKNMMICMFLLCLTMAVPCVAEEVHYPQPKGLVNDFVQLMSPGDAQKLERRLRAYEKETTVEIAVAIVDLPKDVAIEQYAFDLKSIWGVGKKQTNNGVLLLVVPKGSRRVWIAPGSGLQGVLTDLQCGRTSESIDAMLSKGKYAEAITVGTEMIIRDIGKEPFEQKMKESLVPKKADDSSSLLLVALIPLGIIVTLIILFIRSRSRKNDNPENESQPLQEEEHSMDRQRARSYSPISGGNIFREVHPADFHRNRNARPAETFRPSPPPIQRKDDEDDVTDVALAAAAGGVIGSMLSSDDSRQSAPVEESFSFGEDHEKTGAGAGSGARAEQTDESVVERDDPPPEQASATEEQDDAPEASEVADSPEDSGSSPDSNDP